MAEEKILIVDDERLVRWALKSTCTEWGYQVFEAENGTSALRIARAELPDLILLDIRLPDINGMEILHRLKEDATARAVIMITGIDSVVSSALRNSNVW